jgi:hypothetical protein
MDLVVATAEAVEFVEFAVAAATTTAIPAATAAGLRRGAAAAAAEATVAVAATGTAVQEAPAAAKVTTIVPPVTAEPATAASEAGALPAAATNAAHAAGVAAVAAAGIYVARVAARSAAAAAAASNDQWFASIDNETPAAATAARTELTATITAHTADEQGECRLCREVKVACHFGSETPGALVTAAALRPVGSDSVEARVQCDRQLRPTIRVVAGLGVSDKHSKLQDQRNRTAHGA